jgi:hypothetical protein
VIDIADFAKRVRRRTWLAGLLFFGGALLMVLDFSVRISRAAKGELAVLCGLIMGIGLFFYYRSLELPQKEIIQLAESKGGVLSLSEISTALAIEPAIALRTLLRLQRLGVATPRWADLQKNLWEFPDYTKLPIAETIDLARERGGKISLHDLVAGGHSPEVARQTFDTLSEKGLARQQGAELLLGS